MYTDVNFYHKEFLYISRTYVSIYHSSTPPGALEKVKLGEKCTNVHSLKRNSPASDLKPAVPGLSFSQSCHFGSWKKQTNKP